jgi:hypothetical protein
MWYNNGEVETLKTGDKEMIVGAVVGGVIVAVGYGVVRIITFSIDITGAFDSYADENDTEYDEDIVDEG